MIITDNRWKCSHTHMKEMHKQRDFATPFIHSLIKTWLLGDDEQKKDLEKVFMFLTDPQIVVQFENGDEVEANSKTEKPPYEIGDTVWYEVTKETQYGKKAKVTKQDPAQNFQASSGSSKSSPETQAKIDNCWSIGQAISVLGCVDQVNEESLTNYLQEVDKLSDHILAIRNSKL